MRGTSMERADFIAGAYALGAGPWTTAPVTRGALGQISQVATTDAPPPCSSQRTTAHR
ncbi:hypothetical protein [Streptomyces dysideae]|uniref:hypothetical protein n=1 Tax=Streptomyces dysideae TaxID=909626 RepID=UPI002D218420|nr:hypothetical protein [Streptomyces dysideae]